MTNYTYLNCKIWSILAYAYTYETTLKSRYALSFLTLFCISSLSCLSTSRSHWSACCHWSLYPLEIFVWLLLHNTVILKFLQIVACVRSSLVLFFFQLLRNNPWYGYSTITLLIYLLMDIWIVSSFWLLQIMRLEHSCTRLCWMYASISLR